MSAAPGWRCQRCKSGLVYRDRDGDGCMVCGWHSWERAREEQPARRNAARARRRLASAEDHEDHEEAI